MLASALVTLAAALAVGVSTTVGYALATGYERAAQRSDQPDVLARFAPVRRSALDARLRRLPNVVRISYRGEVNRVGLAANGRSTRNGAVHIVHGGRRGYGVVAGHDLGSRSGEVLVERGVATAWGLRVGDELRIGGLGALRIAGVALSVDNVAFPLAAVPRVYVSAAEVGRRFGRERDPVVNVALLWLADPGRLDITLSAARPAIFGLRTEQLLTRRGVRQAIDQAAGVVIALLIVFGVVAAACAGAMLAAAADARVRRRAAVLGIERALGASRAQVVGDQALDAVLIAAPAAALGLTAGALLAIGPATTLLGFLNEVAPGAALLAPLAAAYTGLLAVVAAGAAWPAWQVTRRPIAALLRGGDLSPPTRRIRAGARPALLGARFATARRGRWLGSVVVLGVAIATVLLVLAVADLLVALRDDPGTLGRRYALTVTGDRSDLPAVRAVPGVAAADQRTTIEAADSFSLTEPLRVIAYRGDHVPFEAPPLQSGRRLRSAGEVEVGDGLADALGLRPGGQLALQPVNGRELRFRVVGVVRALENNGRVVYARSARFERDDPDLGGPIAVRLDAGADRGDVLRALAAAGFAGRASAGTTTSNRSFLGILATVLRTVALAIGLVCLAAITQALALTARDRRRALALLRAGGASRHTLGALLGGAAAAVLLPALAFALALERLVLGPIVARLTADYATLPLHPGGVGLAVVGGGLALAGTIAALAAARTATREPVATGLGRADG